PNIRRISRRAASTRRRWRTRSPTSARERAMRSTRPTSSTTGTRPISSPRSRAASTSTPGSSRPIFKPRSRLALALLSRLRRLFRRALAFAARQRLQHGEAIAFRIEKGDVGPDAGDLHRFAEDLAAGRLDFPHRDLDIVDRDDDGRMLRGPVAL